MINKNDSLLSIAKEVVKESKRGLSIKEIANKVFKAKGITPTEEQIAQFGIDFMLSGEFICCGNRNKENIWDVKGRQPLAVLDKDVIEDIYENDEEVKKNALTEDMYPEEPEVIEEEEDENGETDEIAAELDLITESEEGDIITEREVIDRDEDEDEEDSDDEEEPEDGDLEEIVVGTYKEE